MEYVVLVDEDDQEIGTMEKQQAHMEARLHRAISVFIFNSKNELLLHKRAAGKYHSANLWTNTCCSHPRPGESVQHAAIRRLQEEMGLACDQKHIFSFIYKAQLENGLTEYELDHVFTGTCDDVPQPDEQEVAAWRYVSFEALEKEMKTNPGAFTEWFKICFSEWREELFELNDNR